MWWSISHYFVAGAWATVFRVKYGESAYKTVAQWSHIFIYWTVSATIIRIFFMWRPHIHPDKCHPTPELLMYGLSLSFFFLSSVAVVVIALSFGRSVGPSVSVSNKIAIAPSKGQKPNYRFSETCVQKVKPSEIMTMLMDFFFFLFSCIFHNHSDSFLHRLIEIRKLCELIIGIV